MVKQISLVAEFEKFIRDTKSKKRCKLDGSCIKPSTQGNYIYTLKLLREYEQYSGKPLVLLSNTGKNERLLRKEKIYWNNFYRQFSQFLFYKKGCHDNYCGHVFKIIKSFFRYTRNERLINLTPFYDKFHVRREEIRVISLLPEQLCFLFMDKAFEQRLKRNLKLTKDCFVFGCATALRFSDLMNLRVNDLEKRSDEYFLNYLSVKTASGVKVKLPSFAVAIFLKFAGRKRAGSRVFPAISLSSFNKRIKKIGDLAGWTEPFGKFRLKNGTATEQRMKQQTYRFCDLLSSHVMRKTGITFLLMMGMPEYLVRKISGHAAHSRSFFRYVNFANSYITDEINKAHSKLLSSYKPSPSIPFQGKIID